MLGRFISWLGTGLARRYGGRSVGSVLGWVLSTAAMLMVAHVIVVPADAPVWVRSGLVVVSSVLVAVVAFKESRPIQKARAERATHLDRDSLGLGFSVVGVLFSSALFVVVGMSEWFDFVIVALQSLFAFVEVVLILRGLSRVPADGDSAREAL